MEAVELGIRLGPTPMLIVGQRTRSERTLIRNKRHASSCIAIIKLVSNGKKNTDC